MIKSTRVDFYCDFGGIGGGIDFVSKLGIPIAEAMRSIDQTFDVAVGTPAQGFLGCRGLIFELLQLGDFVEQVGKLAVLSSGNLGTIIDIGAHGRPERRN